MSRYTVEHCGQSWHLNVDRRSSFTTRAIGRVQYVCRSTWWKCKLVGFCYVKGRNVSYNPSVMYSIFLPIPAMCRLSCNLELAGREAGNGSKFWEPQPPLIETVFIDVY